MRNISDEQNASTERTNMPQPDRDTAVLRQALLDEMTSWSPRDRGGVFKTWHRHALSLVHLNVLTALEADGDLSMTQLAQAMDVSDASATGIIDRMEKRGLVERRHDTDDRRKVVVHPTEAGIQIFRTMAEHRREILTKVLDELNEGELNHLLIGFRALTSARQRVLARQLPEANEATNGSTNDTTNETAAGSVI